MHSAYIEALELEARERVRIINETLLIIELCLDENPQRCKMFPIMVKCNECYNKIMETVDHLAEVGELYSVYRDHLRQRSQQFVGTVNLLQRTRKLSLYERELLEDLNLSINAGRRVSVEVTRAYMSMKSRQTVLGKAQLATGPIYATKALFQGLLNSFHEFSAGLQSKMQELARTRFLVQFQDIMEELMEKEAELTQLLDDYEDQLEIADVHIMQFIEIHNDIINSERCNQDLDEAGAKECRDLASGLGDSIIAISSPFLRCRIFRHSSFVYVAMIDEITSRRFYHGSDYYEQYIRMRDYKLVRNSMETAEHLRMEKALLEDCRFVLMSLVDDLYHKKYAPKHDDRSEKIAHEKAVFVEYGERIEDFSASFYKGCILRNLASKKLEGSTRSQAPLTMLEVVTNSPKPFSVSITKSPARKVSENKPRNMIDVFLDRTQRKRRNSDPTSAPLGSLFQQGRAHRSKSFIEAGVHGTTEMIEGMTKCKSEVALSVGQSHQQSHSSPFHP